MSSKKRLLKNSGIYSLVQILQKAIGLFLLPVYTALLSPSDKGITDVVQPLVAFLSIFYTLSLNSAVVRFYVDYKENNKKLKEFWGTCISFVIMNSFILTIILIIFKDVILLPIAKGINFYPYIILGLISITFNPIYTIFQSTLQAKEQSALYGLNNLLYFIVNLSLNIFFVVVLRVGALGVLLALAITDTIFFIYTLIKFIPTITMKIKKSYLIQALKYSLPLLPHSLSGWAVSMIDRLFLNGYEGLAVPAIYSTGSQFANIINVITVAVNQAYVPWFFEKMKDKEKNELEIVKVSEYTTIIYCFLAMGMSLFGPEIFKIMVADAYSEGWKVIPLLSFSFVFNGIYYFYVNPLFYNKKGVKYIAIGTFTGAILNSLLNIVLIPKFSMMGAALASLIAMILSCILVYLISKRIEPIRFNIVKLFFISGVFLAVSMLSFIIIGFSFWKSILIKTIIVLIIFLILVFIYRKDFDKYIKLIKGRLKK
ncbi:lipopolysaccharide biosynthesis protein [Clostridium sp. HCS.1]|uniref:lipopolysaccharide biosynthesis protein n=1 Tax=Clostridium sp. HCS.1 TaxID=3238594 RepID=UPI003A0FCFBC